MFLSPVANLEDQLTWMRTDIQEREVLREKLRVERLARLEEMKRTKNEERQRLREEKAKVMSHVVYVDLYFRKRLYSLPSS